MIYEELEYMKVSSVAPVSLAYGAGSLANELSSVERFSIWHIVNKEKI